MDEDLSNSLIHGDGVCGFILVHTIHWKRVNTRAVIEDVIFRSFSQVKVFNFTHNFPAVLIRRGSVHTGD